MSRTSTTLSAAIDGVQTEFAVTATTGFAVGSFLKVDSEFMRIKELVTDYWIRVERGQCGTLAVSHNILALAVVGLAEDFAPIPPWHIYTYGAVSGNITVGPGIHILAYGAQGTYSLPAPGSDQEGLTITFVCASAYAHKIQLASGAFNALTDTEIQFGGAIGDSATIVAVSGSWMIVAVTNLSLTSRSASVSPSKSASSSASVSASVSPSVSASKSASVSPSAS